jgi:hypothetical protein
MVLRLCVLLSINIRIFKEETSKTIQGLQCQTERYGNAILKIVKRLPNGIDITKENLGSFAPNMKHSLPDSTGVSV